jgi:A/G-specific adenine glycosylase
MSRQLRLFPASAPAGEGRAPVLPPGEARDREIVRALGAWFEVKARDLPWRRGRTPYAVWLSEIMLQQTRVETVIPYFERFLRAYPDVGALASARIDDVLHLWSGLGYYRRARQLHAAAREVTDRYGGVLPEDAEALRSLPGVGAYTAGAIASIAYGRREPLVDGNVARVLARIEAIDEPLKTPSVTRRLWETAARLVPADLPGRFNEGLMELGATVCTPRDPRCDACPLSHVCSARASGRERDLPVVESKRPVPVVAAVAAVIVDGGLVLLARRREGGLFGGLWEPPMVEVPTVEAARRALAAVGVALGRTRLRDVGRVVHVLTHRRMEVTVAVARRASGLSVGETLAEPYERAEWLSPVEPRVGVSTLARKVLAAAGGA